MTASTHIKRRPPSVVMRLKRLGSLHQSRLSFMRILTRRMAAENWRFSRPMFEIDERGVGHAVYTAEAGAGTYSLVAFAHDLPAKKRSDRVIADAWDATFALVDGLPNAADIARLKENVPVQEEGRVSERELTLSRANRSVRLWDHVVDALASGRQPDGDVLARTGYLMRTTAVYGSGKFGAADWETISDRDEMKSPFQAEMLTVYLIRTFVLELVEHMARAKGGAAAVGLDPSLARQLGIGNSTGLGMAPFLVNHPVLLNNWIVVREEALARVRSVERPTSAEVAAFREVLSRAQHLVAGWTSEHPLQVERLEWLTRDLVGIAGQVEAIDFESAYPWERLFGWAEHNASEEGQELLASLLLEPYGDLVDGLADCMSDTNLGATRIDGSISVRETRDALEARFGWALELDWTSKETTARAWYVSAEKLEPRLGERYEEPIAEYEQSLAPARDAALAHAALEAFDDTAPIAEFLLAHPEHRHTIRRAQMSQFAPYGEICDNTIAAEMLPIDMLRAKLSFFGATRFDPRSDRWVRICMYAGAPYPEDLSADTADFWVYPE